MPDGTGFSLADFAQQPVQQAQTTPATLPTVQDQLGGPPAPSVDDSDPTSKYQPIYEAAGKAYGVSPYLLRALTWEESKGNPYAVSPTGARGLTQFTTRTGRAEGMNNPYDPVQSIWGAGRLIRQNYNLYGNVDQALMAYNAGTNPAKWGPGVQGYARDIRARYQTLLPMAPEDQGQQQSEQPAPSTGFSLEDFARSPTAAASAAKPEAGKAGFSLEDFALQQSIPSEFGHGLARGVVTGAGAAIAGPGEFARAGQEGAARQALGLFDQVDKGQKPNPYAGTDKMTGSVDPWVLHNLAQYERASPAQRQALRQQMQSSLAVPPGALEQTGAAVTKYGESIPVAPGMVGKTGEMLGGLAPMAAAGVAAGPAGVGLVIAGQSYDSSYQEAKAKGLSDDDAASYAMKSAGVQTALMAAPISRLVRSLPAPLRDGFRKTLLNIGQHGLEFGGFNSLSTFAQNYVAKNTIDPDRPLMQGVGEAGLEGAVSGMIVPSGMALLGAAARGVQRITRPGTPPPVTPGASPLDIEPETQASRAAAAEQRAKDITATQDQPMPATPSRTPSKPPEATATPPEAPSKPPGAPPEPQVVAPAAAEAAPPEATKPPPPLTPEQAALAEEEEAERAEREGLVPVTNEKGQWIGYRRPEEAPPVTAETPLPGAGQRPGEALATEPNIAEQERARQETMATAMAMSAGERPPATEEPRGEAERQWANAFREPEAPAAVDAAQALAEHAPILEQARRDYFAGDMTEERLAEIQQQHDELGERLANAEQAAREPPSPPREIPAPSSEVTAAYRDADAALREHYPVMEEARDDYQAGRIGDAEFLATQRDHDALMAKYDRAYAAMQGQTELPLSERVEKPAPPVESVPPTEASAQPAPQATTPEPAAEPIVEHVTQKGKKLTGVIRTGLTADQAKAIDKFAFRKGNGWFLREAAIKAQEGRLAAGRPTPGRGGWDEIGKNHIGQTLYEDTNGVRSYIENGVRSTEPVRIAMTGAGPRAAVAGFRKDPDYMLASVMPGSRRTIEYRPPAEPPPAAKLPEPPVPGAYGARNTVFTADAAERARAIIRAKMSQLNAGFDPELAMAGLTLAGFHVEAGARSFVAYSRAMIADMGEAVRPYLRQWYNAVRDHPGFDTTGMSSHAEVEAATNPNPEPQPRPVKTPAAIPEEEVADFVSKRLEAGFTIGELQEAAAEAYGGSLATGAYSRDRLYDAMELGVNRFIAAQPDRFSPRVDAEQAKRTSEDLQKLTDKLPTQTVRAGEKETHQQFSTPPAYAYAAAWAADLRPEDRVIEPSAGVGGLLVFAKDAGVTETVANEISDKRRAMLNALGFDRVTAENAEQLNNVLPDDIKPTVVLMNPPFSSTAGRMGDKMVAQTGANHVEQALKRLQPGGRLVAIVGQGMKPAGAASASGRREGTGEAFRDWWQKIGAQYDVRANIGVGGDIYRKYGTTFPTRLLVIDKSPPSGRAAVTADVRNAGELIDALRGVHDDRSSAGQPIPTEPTGAPLVAPGESGREPVGGLPAPTGEVGAGAGYPLLGPAEPEPAGALPGGGVREPTAPGGPAPSGEGVGVVGGEPGGPGGALEPSEGPAGGGAGGAGSGVRPDGSGRLVTPGEEPPATIQKAERAVTDPTNTELTESVYEPYRPQKVQIAGAKEHPGALVQSAAMATVDPPTPDYVPKLPQALVDSGALSDAQLEAITYAGQAHNSEMLPRSGDEPERRRGFFIGDGTGTGKGREVAGIILDNFAQGRTKAVWISENSPLLQDATRDWTGLGGKKEDLIEHGRVKASAAIGAKQGILFTTYDTLKSAERVKGTPKEGEAAGPAARGKTRLQQITDWVGKDFDGVIAFDEAHNMGNAIQQTGEFQRRKTKPSQKALAGMELQRALPKARVVYVSATGATEVSNLGYADRLGLWGRDTAFANQKDFLSRISSGGIAAMELIARDMKALGHYIARNLSYDGVEYDRLEHPLTGDQRALYDKMAEGWQVVLQHFNDALAATLGNRDTRAKAAAMSQFWGAHQRFFNQIITSMQMPTVLRAVEADVKEGRQAVLQLVNTMEAAQERAIDKARAKEGEEAELEDLDMTPRDQLMQMVESAYPVHQYEEYADDNGTVGVRQVVDANDQPVVNKEMVAKRDKLLDELGSLRVPDGPLEILLNQFGTDQVAEVTGRKQRVVRKPDDKGQMRTVVEKRPGAANVAEASAFQEGKKPILVFSQAGGTGRSYHAEVGSGSADARRVHYLVQPGWRADKAVQGFGRTHRTNQASAPIFRLVTTDLDGQKRFISSIARRLGQLGALTKGERRTGDQGLFGLRDNLESDEARAALREYFSDLYNNDIRGLWDFEKNTGLQLRTQTGGLRADLPPITQFLNRLLSLKIDQQNQTFGAFAKKLDAVIERSAAAGTLDTGTETYKADGIKKVSDSVVYKDMRSGAETRHVQLEARNRNRPLPFQDAVNRKPGFFVQSARTGKVFAVFDGGTYTNKDGQVVPEYRLLGHLSYQYIDRDKVDRDKGNWEKVSPEQARPLWDKQVAETPEFRTEDLHLVTGAVLPIWDRLGGDPKIFRLQTDDGERMLGRVIPNDAVNETLANLGAEALKVTATPDEIAQRVTQGGTARLANGWVMKPVRVAGEQRIELVGPDYRYNDQLEQDGVFRERIQYDTRYFVPTGEKAAATIEAITKGRPVVALENPKGEVSGSGIGLYSGFAMFDPALWRALFRGTPAPTTAGPKFDEPVSSKTGLDRRLTEVRVAFSPTSVLGAKPMEYSLRRMGAEAARSYNQAVDTLQKVRNVIDRADRNDQVAFMDRMERGQAQPTPELQAIADSLRKVLDDWRDKIQSMGKGLLSSAIDDYMGRIYGNYKEWTAKQQSKLTQAQMAERARAAAQGKRPLLGSGNFLKQRTFPYFVDALQAGLVPVTYNPIDMQLMKLREMMKFYHGSTLADDMKQSTELGVQWVRAGPKAEENARAAGLAKLNDRVFQPRRVVAQGRLEYGNWYAPEPVARVFNNYMSPGLADRSKIVNDFRAAGNALNFMQLSLSGFHATFIALDSSTSQIALGLQQLGSRPLEGVKNAVLGVTPHALIKTIWDGSKLRDAWLNPAAAGPDWARTAEDMAIGGGRMQMDAFYQSTASGSFIKSFADLKDPRSVFYQIQQMWRDADGPFEKAAAVSYKLAARVLETTAHPLMEYLVPRAKMGVFAALAKDWHARNPLATPDERAAAMTQFWDSVDNRMGQMVYDNVFWNKAAKDIAFITTRSVGWNLGTIREIGGGVVDGGKLAADLAGGRAPKFTTRMAYTIAMPITTAIYGAMITYLTTGGAPQQLLDYFFPPDGSGGRLIIPGYLKDVIEYTKAPVQTLLNKTQPLIEVLQELRHNQDYYGGSIYDPERDLPGHPIEGRAVGYGDYLLNELMPFSWRGYLRQNEKGASMMGQALSFWGIQPAPKSITAPGIEEKYEARQAKAAFKKRVREPGRIEPLHRLFGQ